jgi:hypothetical protein
VLGMLCSWAAGYVMRSPLQASEPLSALVVFDPDVLARAKDLADHWEQFRALPRYQEFVSNPSGAAWVQNSLPARAAERIENAASVWGVPWIGLFDVVGEEVVGGAALDAEGRRMVFALSRLTARANLALGLYAAWQGTQPVPGGPVGAWMVVQRDVGLAWTKIGNVLVISNDIRVLALIADAARKTQRTPGVLAAELNADADPQIAFRHAGAMRSAKPSVLKVRLGQSNGPAVMPPDGPEHAAFRYAAVELMPSDISLGALWRLEPRAVWKLLLAPLSPGDVDALQRYIEDDLCAVLNVDDFEGEFLERFTGDVMGVITGSSDAWMLLASERPGPTVALVFRVRSDASFERRLHHALVEVGATLARQAEGLSLEPILQEHRGVRLRGLRFKRPGMRKVADSGFFVVPDNRSPGESLLVVSTSLAWLRRSIDAREGAGASLARQEWLRNTLRTTSPQATAMAFARGDQLGEMLGHITGQTQGPTRPLVQWLTLLGQVEMTGQVAPDGSVRGVLRITGQRLTPRSPQRR